MTWESLSSTVAKLHAVRPGGGVDDFRVSAATMAAQVFGAGALLGAPALVNCAGLALSMARLVRYELTADAIALVHGTDLHTLPGEPPRLLRGAWILESRHPEKHPLIESDMGRWGMTASLGGYPLDGAIYLVGIGYPDGIAVARWAAKWTGEDLAEGIPPDSSPLIDDVDQHRSWAREAARLAVVFSLLLEAASRPITVDEPPGERKRRAYGANNGSRSWTVRRVHLRMPTPRRSAPLGEGTDQALRDRQGVNVSVRGHLKRQPYGPGATLRRWVYVEAYQARRWIAPRPARIIVGA